MKPRRAHNLRPPLVPQTRKLRYLLRRETESTRLDPKLEMGLPRRLVLRDRGVMRGRGAGRVVGGGAGLSRRGLGMSLMMRTRSRI